MAHQLIGYYTIADQTDGVLKVLRSYQYEAVRAIHDKVVKHRDWRSEDKQLGGYIWHTTGSGKTLSSFKAAQLIAMSKRADKVVFVIDRIELGTQSAREYRNFAGALEDIQETEDTSTLISKLNSPDIENTLIVTSVQKLGIIAESATYKHRLKEAKSKRIVFIVDECHRSTFGESFAAIKATFPTALFFGFTGTPIQLENERAGSTTTDIFGDELHRYSIADGIRDKNVLGFDPYKVPTYSDKTLRIAVALKKAGVNSIEEVDASEEYRRIFDEWMARPMAGQWQEDGTYIKGIEDEVPNSQYERDEHCQAVVEDIIKDIQWRSRGGKFHAIFATSSIPQAIRYYRLFKEKAPELKVTALFDPSLPNDNPDKVLAKESGLEEILRDYNERYDQHFDLAGHAKFKKDLSNRLAHKKPYINIKDEAKIDLLIVVSQMLTGFDSKWVNTLYIDKVMVYADLIQAFSRTNRLFGSEKPFGVIKYYQRPHTMERNIKDAVRLYSGNQPLALFVNKLGENLNGMNQMFTEIKFLFEGVGISNFTTLPQEVVMKVRFASLFRDYNHYLEAAKVQGFHWKKLEYTVDKQTIQLNHDEHLYNTLLKRYKELFNKEGESKESSGGSVPYDIDPYLVEIDTEKIDTDYMNRNFDRYIKALKQEDISEAELQNLLNELSASFSSLSQEEQSFAEVLLHDIQSNNITLDPTKTFRDYITEYLVSQQENATDELVNALGLDKELLMKIIEGNPTSKDLDQFGRFSALKQTVDRSKAKAYLEETLGQKLPLPKVISRVDELLRKFILEGKILD